MVESQRQHAILELLTQRQQISVADIAETFAVSLVTARRDINKLHAMGKLLKIRNGAEMIPNVKVTWKPLNIHQIIHVSEKIRIARAASQLCQAGESIIINCGSTAFLLGKELCGKDVQVITNYLPLANYLIDKEHSSVVIMGGQYDKTQQITLTPQYDYFSTFAGHWMFTSGSGLTLDGLYKMDMLTAINEQKMLGYTDKLVVLVDSSKIAKHAGMLFARLDQIDIVITGNEANPDVVAALRQKNIEVILV